MKVIVDGENFRHQIAHVLYAHKKITHNSAWLNRSVAAQASKTITYDDKLVLKYFRGEN